MDLTVIYSCGPEADFGDTVRKLKSNHAVVWYPEINKSICGVPVPVHPASQIQMMPLLKGRSIVTMSEHIILAFLCEIRQERMAPNDLLLFCAGRRIWVDSEGDLMNDWDGGFLHERAQLLF